MHEYKGEELKEYLEKLKRTFEVVRVVDPVKSKVSYVEGLDNTPINSSCFEVWNRGGICSNCISTRGIKENRTATKIEYNEMGTYLVIATPIILNHEKSAIEMILDIADVDTIVDLNEENNKQIEGIITQLKENLLKDELTGVHNRRFINENIQIDIEHGKSKGIDSVAVIMVDIDDFKEINDLYGHLVGDRTLKRIASILNSRIRADFDWVARYGGDEFIILLKNADEAIANRVVASIQEEVNNSNLICADAEAKITLSFGIHIIETGAMSYERVLEIIDGNLNRAKSLGKNRVVISW